MSDEQGEVGNRVAVSITIIESNDRQLAAMARAAGLKTSPSTVTVADLLALAQPNGSLPDVVIIDIREANSLPPTIGDAASASTPRPVSSSSRPRSIRC